MAKQKKSTFERLRNGALNRQQRRDLGRRLAANDPGLTIVHPNAGGIDVGNESHFVAVPQDRDPIPVQEFGCWTADLKRMAAWLSACRIDTVAAGSGVCCVYGTGLVSVPCVLTHGALEKQAADLLGLLFVVETISPAAQFLGKPAQHVFSIPPGLWNDRVIDVVDATLSLA